MVTALNSANNTLYKTGYNLYMLALNVPDFWITSVEGTNVPYTYTTDQALIELVNAAPLQIGYYKITKLESEKVDLSDYVETSEIVNDLTTGGTTVPLSAEQGKKS